jgi:hypothetical protein
MRAFLAIALLLSVSLPGPTFAQVFRAPCQVDTLCAGVPRGGGKILACLRTHKAELSDECFAALGHFLMNQRSKADASPDQPTAPGAAPDNDAPPEQPPK